MLFSELLEAQIAPKHSEPMSRRRCFDWRTGVLEGLAGHLLEEKRALARGPRLVLALVLLGARPRAEDTKHCEAVRDSVMSLRERNRLVLTRVTAMPAANLTPVGGRPRQLLLVAVHWVPEDPNVRPCLVQKHVEA